MANDLTAKDVLYALEYLGDALIRSPAKTNRTNWQMRKSGLGVKEKVANEVRENRSTLSINDAGNQIIKWRN
jgi:hypothetical protein